MRLAARLPVWGWLSSKPSLVPKKVINNSPITKLIILNLHVNHLAAQDNHFGTACSIDQ